LIGRNLECVVTERGVGKRLGQVGAAKKEEHPENTVSKGGKGEETGRAIPERGRARLYNGGYGEV